MALSAKHAEEEAGEFWCGFIVHPVKLWKWNQKDSDRVSRNMCVYTFKKYDIRFIYEITENLLA